MNFLIKISFALSLLLNLSYATDNGEKIFKEYCWGCHHQTSVAFGPSFEQIANLRTIDEIQGQIIAPEAMYKQLGYKRTAMPSFKDKLNQEQLDSIANYILSFKTKAK